ncbi:gamma-crystallin N-like [Penaeus chinensis]|uniref:gamma-crystallin N-like n=1 Tax=Penaeus chinensis TaxID=139456 RepID=UPI001FB8474F|nr:gamma-crystallin N-like [Penaeus chinensis]
MKLNVTSAVLLLVLVGVSPGSASYSSETRCWADQNQHGEWFDFNEFFHNLADIHFDNTIESVRETGMWMYYEHADYNTHQAGLVFWASGIDFSGNVPAQYANMATSLRYAGSPYSLDDETWNVYSGEAFTGDALWGYEDAASLGSLGDDVSSIIIVGQSAWTFYDGRDFHGTNSVCLRPNFKFGRDSDGRSLHVGIFPTPAHFQISDNNIESVRKGCWSENVVYGESVRTNSSSPSGACGFLNG